MTSAHRRDSQPQFALDPDDDRPASGNYGEISYTQFLNPERWAFSNHSLIRALDMELTPEMMIDVLTRPDMVRPSVKYEGCRNYAYGDLTAGVSVQQVPFVVVTFVFNSEQAWRDHLGNGKSYDTRRYRKNGTLPNFLLG